MKDVIKEKLLKEIEHLERMRDGNLQLDCGLPIDKEVANKLFRNSLAERNLWGLNAKLQQHEETSKAKDEEELKFLFEMNSKYKLFNGNVFMNDMVKDRIDKIKKDLKENEK